MRMKNIMYSVVIASALALMSSLACAQAAKTDRVEAGITSSGLPLGQVRPMTVAIAKQIVAAAKESSCKPPSGSCSGAFAVVDDAGVLVYFETIDGVLAGGPDLAIRKATTSALWRRPTVVFQEAVNDKSNTAYADGTFTNMTTSPGGIPIFRNGRIVGGLGIGAVGDATDQITAAVEAVISKIFGPQPPFPKY